MVKYCFNCTNETTANFPEILLLDGVPLQIYFCKWDCVFEYIEREINYLNFPKDVGTVDFDASYFEESDDD